MQRRDFITLLGGAAAAWPLAAYAQQAVKLYRIGILSPELLPPGSDGFANAPTLVPSQYPNLLNGYAVRPPWKVAGVDYAVGPRVSPTLNPATITDSVHFDLSRLASKQLMVIGANATLTGYDFDGWHVFIVADNCTITDCQFLNSCGINVAQDWDGNNPVLVNNFTFRYNIVNPMGNQDIVWQQPIHSWARGILIFEYNLLLNAFAEHLQFMPNDLNYVTEIWLRYNVMGDVGYKGSGPTHRDFTQTWTQAYINGFWATFNTVFQTDPSNAGTQGFSLEHWYSDTNSIRYNYISMCNCTLIAKTSNVNYFLLFGLGRTRIAVDIKDNYVDRTNAAYLYTTHPDQPGPEHPVLTVSGNYDMVTGSPYNP